MGASSRIPTINASNRTFRVNAATATLPGFPFIEIGPAGTTTFVSTMMVQFNPDNLFAGNFVVMGKMLGQAADTAGMPFLPIPYRRVSLNNVASDYAMVSDAIAGPALIEIPANGMSIVILDGLDAGTMDLAMWDLQGNSAV